MYTASPSTCKPWRSQTEFAARFLLLLLWRPSSGPPMTFKLVLLHHNATCHLSVQNTQHKAQSKAFGLLELHKKKWPWPFNIALQRRKWKIKQCCKLVWLDFCSFRWWSSATIAYIPPYFFVFVTALAWNVNLICFSQSYNNPSNNFFMRKTSL